MTQVPRLPRRMVLKGLGAAVALPWLEAMMPSPLSAAARSAKPPVRMAFVFVPNGVILPQWKLSYEGALKELSPTLQPLEPVKEHLLVLTNLMHDNARAKGDGPGDHARCSAAFLTGAHPYKTSGADIRNGISVDQFAAQRIGNKTRFPSLELGCDASRMTGNCDSGYSCAYVSNISWKSPTQPAAKEVNPRAVFERLFGSPAKGAQARRRLEYRLSVLDFVAEQARDLRRRVGSKDRQKLDEYFTSIREIEQRLARSEKQKLEQFGPKPPMDLPPGVPPDYAEHIRLMSDLLVLAFQTDSTRIATLMLARAGSNRTFPMVGVKEGHHWLSHHQNNKEKIEKLARIDRFYIEQWAYMLQRMKQIREGNGTLLDHVMVLYGSGISDGNRHWHHDLPVLLAGRGGGTIATGRHIKYPKQLPLTNLFLCMLDRMGIEVERFGDSTGRLNGLEG